MPRTDFHKKGDKKLQARFQEQKAIRKIERKYDNSIIKFVAIGRQANLNVEQLDLYKKQIHVSRAIRLKIDPILFIIQRDIKEYLGQHDVDSTNLTEKKPRFISFNGVGLERYIKENRKKNTQFYEDDETIYVEKLESIFEECDLCRKYLVLLCQSEKTPELTNKLKSFIEDINKFIVTTKKTLEPLMRNDFSEFQNELNKKINGLQEQEIVEIKSFLTETMSLSEGKSTLNLDKFWEGEPILSLEQTIKLNKHCKDYSDKKLKELEEKLKDFRSQNKSDLLFSPLKEEEFSKALNSGNLKKLIELCKEFPDQYYNAVILKETFDKDLRESFNKGFETAVKKGQAATRLFLGENLPREIIVKFTKEWDNYPDIDKFADSIYILKNKNDFKNHVFDFFYKIMSLFCQEKKMRHGSKEKFCSNMIEIAKDPSPTIKYYKDKEEKSKTQKR